MEIAPLRINDPWAQRVQQDPRANSQYLSDVPSEIAVDMDSVSIEHHGPELNYRPYLHLRGRLSELTPEVSLPYGVEKLPFAEGTGPEFNAFYEFTDEQLSDLVAKGYFTPEFEVPHELVETTWDLPARADYLVVFPEYMDQTPVVFAGVRDRSSMALTEASSSYDLHNYFIDHTVEREQGLEEQMQAEHEALETGSNEIRDLFEHEDFELGSDEGYYAHAAQELSSEGATSVPDDVFSKLIAERSEQLDEQAAEIQSQGIAVPVSEEGPEVTQHDNDAARVYRERVAADLKRSREAGIELVESSERIELPKPPANDVVDVEADEDEVDALNKEVERKRQQREALLKDADKGEADHDLDLSEDLDLG